MEQTSEEPKRKVLWIPVIAGSLLLIGAIIGIGMVFRSITREIPEVDISGLELPERTVDPSQNPYPELMMMNVSEERLDRADQLIRKVRENGTVDAAVSDLVDEFSTEMASFDRFASMTDWKAEFELGLDSDYPELKMIRTLGGVKGLEIRRHLDQKEIDEALRKSIRLMKFGNNLQNAGGSLIHYLTGISLLRMGQSTLLAIIEGGKLKLPALRTVAEELDRMPVSPDGLIHAFRIEYANFSKLVDDLAAGEIDYNELVPGTSTGRGRKIPNSFLFKKNRTKQMYADFTRDMIEEAPMIRKDAPRDAIDQIMRIKADTVSMYTSGNPVGLILLSVALPALDSLADSHARFRAGHDLLRLRVAMERYRLDHGDWPEELEALVPELISTVPIDPMDGKPLRYNPETRTIYSVGYDYIDNGGESSKQEPLGDRNEIVIQIGGKDSDQ